MTRGTLTPRGTSTRKTIEKQLSRALSSDEEEEEEQEAKQKGQVVTVAVPRMVDDAATRSRHEVYEEPARGLRDLDKANVLMQQLAALLSRIYVLLAMGALRERTFVAVRC